MNVVRSDPIHRVIAGRPWLISMDEIGMWHTGVVPDDVDPDHDALRRYVLWGSLMAGAAGVEWYFEQNTRTTI